LKYQNSYLKSKCQVLDSFVISWIEILVFRFENNNLKLKYQILDQISLLNLNLKKSELKCQFSDSNNNIQNWTVHFEIQLIIFRLEVLILRIPNNNLELKFEGSNQMII